MRILFILMLFFSFASDLCGQFKGYWGIAGGTIGGSYRNDKVDNFTDIQLNFFVGKFLSEDFLIGGGLRLGTTIRQNIAMPKDRFSSSETGVTTFTRYYLQESERSALYVRSSISFSKIFNTKDVIGLGSPGEPFDYFRVGSGLGISFFVNNNIAINGEIDVSLLERLRSLDVAFSENFKPQLSLGLQFFSNDYDPKSRKKKSKKDKFKALGVDTWNIGGTFELQNRLIGNKRFSLAPSISYFTTRNLGLGIQFNGTYELGITDSRIEINPFLRYYLPMPRGYSFLEGGGGLGVNKFETPNGPTPVQLDSDLFLEGKIGLGLFMSKYTALHGGIRMQYLMPYVAEEIIAEDAFFDVGVEIGIEYFFAPRIISKIKLFEK
ncbi:MAG: hypothetical protein AAGG68_09860 [Bacteroidota bacterium]